MASLLNRLRTRWPVWTMTEEVPIEADEADELARWELITPDSIARLFPSDPERRQTFTRFLKAGHVGIIREEDGRWVAYGWLATPVSGPPDHLPASAASRWWIFYCRTVEEQRGKGHYRRAVARLAREARRRGAGAPLFIDTREDNVAARRAIVRLGFLPAGVVTIYRLPRTKLSFAVWRKQQSHPS